MATMMSFICLWRPALGLLFRKSIALLLLLNVSMLLNYSPERVKFFYTTRYITFQLLCKMTWNTVSRNYYLTNLRLQSHTSAQIPILMRTGLQSFF